MLRALCFAACVAAPSVAHAADSESAAVVLALQADPLLQGRMRDVTDWVTIIGHPALTGLELQGRLAGLTSPSDVSVANLNAWLEESNSREAHFDSQGAASLRERIITAYEHNPLATRTAAAVVAMSLHEAASVNLSEGATGPALKFAHESLRRFSFMPLDTVRHPPRVEQLFRRAAGELKKTASSQLTVRTTAPGRVVLDGAPIGDATTDFTARVFVGEYMLWMEGDGVRSFARKITVRGPADVVDIDLAFEGAFDWAPVPTLRCAPTCEAALTQVARRTSAARVFGLQMSGTGQARMLELNAPTGAISHKDVPALSSVIPFELTSSGPPPPQQFSAWLLAPLGIGQFHQGRYWVGAGFAAAEVGLVVWHIAALRRYNATPAADPDAASNRRLSVNLSAGLLIGAVAAGIAEAVVHHVVASDTGTAD